MRLVSYLSGSVHRRIQTEEFAPPDGIPWRSITQKLQDRYKFQAMGRSEKANTIGAITPAFRSGEWAHKGQIIPIIGLEVTPIEIEVVCNKTDNAQKVVDEIIEMFENDFSFSKITEVEDRFNSQVVVEPNFKFIETIGNWAKCYDLLLNAASDYDLKNSIIPLGLKFLGSDGAQVVDEVFSTFSFERRVTARLQDNWYFSTAPFRSADHFALLEQMEILLLS